MLLNFMLTVTADLSQAVIGGLIAYWLASRTHLWARIVGGIFIVFAGWLSVVEILNRATGYEARSDLDTNIAIIVLLFLGWMAGRNNRRRTSGKPLLLDRAVRITGVGLMVGSQVFGACVGFVTLFVGLGMVSDGAGTLGVIVGLLATPITLFAAPLWAGFKLHNWFPMLLFYGGVVTASLTFWFGKLVSVMTD